MSLTAAASAMTAPEKREKGRRKDNVRFSSAFLPGVLNMIRLSEKWTARLMRQPETGMSYQVGTVLLKDGKVFRQVVIVDGIITQIRGRDDIPFAEDDIGDIVVTHDK
jgi:hypothetical protein